MWDMFWSGLGFATPMGLVIFVLGLVSRKWFVVRLEASVKHEKDRLLEDFKFEIRQRERAAAIAEFLAEWASLEGKEPSKNERTRLHRLVWELSLWLPADLVRELARTCCNVAGSKHPKEILVEVRKILKKDEKDDLLAENIVHWPSAAVLLRIA